MDKVQCGGDFRLRINLATYLGLLRRNHRLQRRLAGLQFLEDGGYRLVLRVRLCPGRVAGDGIQLALHLRQFRPQPGESLIGLLILLDFGGQLRERLLRLIDARNTLGDEPMRQPVTTFREDQ